jgi:transcriptional regulator with XRE-family HTH domain
MSQAPTQQRTPRTPQYTFKADVAVMARLRKGWSRRDVMNESRARSLPLVDESNLAKYETGDLLPSARVLLTLATLLDLSVEDLAEPRAKDAAA